ncbi:hypothetical protein CJF30_00001121 [Rutstroemia sp. NJR-2017a BBW]|nr:hypothetical protein CJF30_00001121 [Rutstroemia sp. NJR-2017a BBW]
MAMVIWGIVRCSRVCRVCVARRRILGVRGCRG